MVKEDATELKFYQKNEVATISFDPEELKQKRSLKKPYFTFKTIGNVIQYLLENFYQHKFTKSPFKDLNKLQIIQALTNTVRTFTPRIFIKIFI